MRNRRCRLAAFLLVAGLGVCPARADFLVGATGGHTFRNGFISQDTGSPTGPSYNATDNGSNRVARPPLLFAESANALTTTATATTLGVGASSSASIGNFLNTARAAGSASGTIDFAVDAGGFYEVSGGIGLTAASNRILDPEVNLDYRASVVLRDLTAAVDLIRASMAYTAGAVTSSGSIPAFVTLTAGRSYRLTVSSNSYASTRYDATHPLFPDGSAGGNSSASVTLRLPVVAAVPEPSTIALSGLGLAATALVVRRRRATAPAAA